MLRLDRLVLREIRLALKEPFRISSGVVAERRICLVELYDADGVMTWAECVAGEQPNYTPETIDTAWFAVREWLAPRLLGRSFDGPEVIQGVLEQNVRGHNMAKAALEMGMWALAATKERVSLSKRLGGTRERIPTGISLGIQANPE
ncbi:MAG TPA: o-succinylbenzoate synthase, partial [Gemmatimonadaceae bacterium]|nr:o-succinylbenzoate synthase [Gemmatimonadaceae bacterium]